jgi:sterol desaturase/sphingolipid hydroxylase (fatty acid hydroxylase superfamily)
LALRPAIQIHNRRKILFLKELEKMKIEQRLKYLRIFLIIFGIIFVFGLYPLMNWIWPSGWRWEPWQYEYEQMIVGIYATLGVFLLIASRNPLAHKSLIWFTVWSSGVHGAIMAIQAIVDPTERIHLVGDVLALFVITVVLGILMPRDKKLAD